MAASRPARCAWLSANQSVPGSPWRRIAGIFDQEDQRDGCDAGSVPASGARTPARRHRSRRCRRRRSWADPSPVRPPAPAGSDCGSASRAAPRRAVRTRRPGRVVVVAGGLQMVGALQRVVGNFRRERGDRAVAHHVEHADVARHRVDERLPGCAGRRTRPVRIGGTAPSRAAPAAGAAVPAGRVRDEPGGSCTRTASLLRCGAGDLH